MMLVFTNFKYAQEAKYHLSSYILGITQGKPAPNVKIGLSRQDKNGKWLIIDEKLIDQNGRIQKFLIVEKGIELPGDLQTDLPHQTIF